MGSNNVWTEEDNVSISILNGIQISFCHSFETYLLRLNYVPDTSKCWEHKIKEDIIIILKNFTLDLWFFKNMVCLVKIKFSAKYEISKQIKKNLCYLAVIRYQDLYFKKCVPRCCFPINIQVGMMWIMTKYLA